MSGSAMHGRVRDHWSVEVEGNYIGKQKMNFWKDRGLPASLWRPLPALAVRVGGVCCIQ